jgi:hypothetical protein
MKNNKARPRHPVSLKEAARDMRLDGRTHREIASQLGIAIGTAHAWTKDIQITSEQKAAISRRKRQRAPMSEDERAAVKRLLAPYLFKQKYSAESLIARIRDFYAANGRIPLKREFNAWRMYARHFGSWNAAIRAAGFAENPELFARKFAAKDGHSCDSFTEKIIDDWLGERGVTHERAVRYPGTRYTADFEIGGTLVEFFGLAGVQEDYDANIVAKRAIAEREGLSLIEQYPSDLYPVNMLAAKLGTLCPINMHR